MNSRNVRTITQSSSTARFVAGTGRQIMGDKDGIQFERAQVYLPHSTWNKLRALGKQHGVSDSMILEQLVEIAHATA